MVVLAPAAGHLILSGDYAAAAGVVAVAGAFDALDGFVARRFDQRSVLGAYLDPAADKVMLVTCALCLGHQGVLPAWLVALFVARNAGPRRRRAAAARAHAAAGRRAAADGGRARGSGGG